MTSAPRRPIVADTAADAALAAMGADLGGATVARWIADFVAATADRRSRRSDPRPGRPARPQLRWSCISSSMATCSPSISRPLWSGTSNSMPKSLRQISA